MFEKLERLVAGKNANDLYEKKDAIEQRYGKWYEEPRNNPWSTEFDKEAYREVTQQFVRDFTGNGYGGFAVSWNNLTADVPYSETSGHDTVGARLQKPVKKLSKVAACNFEKSEDKRILSLVSGYAKEGDLVLIQSPPGAGTSTFLNLLSGATKTYKEVGGEVLYNGDDIWDKRVGQLYNHNIVRVRQDDFHFPQLTVKETLEFAARCGVPDFWPFAEVVRSHRVELISRFLGINHVLSLPVGDESLRGVSGGERKRVSIAETLCGAMGSVVFLDNISKGLDAATTLDICTGIHKYAKEFNSVVFCSLQQLGNEAFRLFDKVMLLDSGKCIYFGGVGEVEGYFNSIGFERPPMRSMADFMLSVSDPLISKSVTKVECLGSAPKTVEEFEKLYHHSEHYADVLEKLQEGVCGDAIPKSELPKSNQKILKRECLQTYPSQFCYLLRRSMRLSWDRRTVMTDFGTKILIAFLVGTMFWQLPLTASGAYTRTGLLFMVCTIFAISAVSGVAKKYKYNCVFLKQRESRFYHASPFHLSGVIDAFIKNAIICVVFSTLIYLMVGLNLSDAGIHYAYFYFMILTLATTMEMMARFVTVVVPTSDGAIMLIGVLAVSFIIYSGYLIPLASVPDWFIWIYWMSPVQFAYRGLMYNEFTGLEFTCDEDERIPANPYVPISDRTCTVGSGADYINDRYSFPADQDWISYSLITLWGTILLLFVGVIIFARRQRLRGKTLVSRKASRGIEDDMSSVELPDETSSVGIKRAYFTWKGVSYDVPMGKGETKQLLDNISGYAVPGKLCALMGASGAGKTTLMDVLAQRKNKGSIQGDVKVNGHDQDELFCRLSGYVEQMDIHISKTTVREAIEFSAALRLPHDVSEEERSELIEKTLDLLELRELQNSIIGTPGQAQALSDEQRKRLTIAVELVVKPSVLFLDEPTSGLDSRAALKVANALRRVADTGCSVLCTIHQPSREVFYCFDSLLLLQQGGKTVYFGDLGESSSIMTSYFVRNGAEPMDAEANPADYMLDQICAGVSAKNRAEQDWGEIWNNSPENKALIDALEGPDARPRIVPEDVEHINFEHKFARNFWTQLRVNMKRQMNVYWRTPEYNYSRILSALVQALLLGFSYFQVQKDQNGANLLVAATFMAGLTALMSINNAVATVINGRVAFYRETSAGYYTPGAYYVPLLVTDQPFNLVSQLLYSVTLYFLIGFKAAGYGYFLLSVILYGTWAISTGAMFGAISPTIDIGLILVPLMNAVLNLLAGFLITRNEIPPWYIWIYWINPTAYFMVGNMKNTLTGTEFFCTADEYLEFTYPGATNSSYEYPSCETIPATQQYITNPSNSTECVFCPITSGDQVLTMLDVPDYNMWISIAALIAFIVFSRLVGLIGFKYFRFLKR
ncbi:hypothetical protein NDN08_003306 [Rhodosorus marinus]|uniref:Probable ATP-dependent transporter ycf16 n=1 Tax=Rhodosorus marinus TaxID=101924 RepID=A0AAV8UWN3_9RHOD|nr:hypothetical protein NDN08_003306 [Rhodosorus marinus]